MEVASGERPVTLATGGEGEGDGDVGEPHCVWQRSWVKEGGMPW